MSTGHTIPLSPPRLWINDLLAVSRGIPLVPFERRIEVAALASLRAEAHIGWCAIFVKAMALVSRRRPELRRSWLCWPRPRLYQHASNIAMVAVERTWNNEPAVFFGRINSPESLNLREIQSQLLRLKSAPVDQIRDYRRLFRVSRWPMPARRWLWRLAHNWSGPLREKCFGTFGISVTAGQGASALSLISPTTTTLCYSPLDDSNSLRIRLVFDHRVLDGGPVARALADIEDTLQGVIFDELQQIVVQEGPSFPPPVSEVAGGFGITQSEQRRSRSGGV